ncbi:hypothetical protein ACC861_37930, partial [Rhizobium ruizarguesonis]
PHSCVAVRGLTSPRRPAHSARKLRSSGRGDKDLSLKAMGNVALAGTAIDSIKVDAALANVPAYLANNFVPDLAAEDAISG